MKTLYEKLLPIIVREFSIGSIDNVEILRRMETGFFGAEVYEVEIKNPSKYQGKFFLKIDSKDEEFRSHEIAQAFSHSVAYIEAKEVSDGQPSDWGYDGTAAEEDLRGIKQEYQRKNILFVAAAIGEDKPSIQRIYGDSFLDITDLEKLSAKLTAVVKKHIRI